ncbi:hypothetical protein [Alloactinosynnema sp. L-07]|uniref:hypothetical protein n=1 Tax=Alloactinosynnema sp. L-07 TaxID=1653480 RepID=UPI00065EF220|nr:hypothetical protein [Alloactinosynnema sp. L-07]CRK57082.1 hypothetical protein [Alloactinosynnema sp. L-07]
MTTESFPAVSSPWESLARHARWLADHAEHVATLSPAERYEPSTDQEADVDHLAAIQERVDALSSVAAACRRQTWQALVDEGWSQKRIADRWGVTNKAVSAALSRGRRPVTTGSSHRTPVTEGAER